MSSFRNSPELKDFLNRLLKKHYPKESTPEWVDRKKFCAHFKKEVYMEVRDALANEDLDGEDIGDVVAILNSIAIAYCSDEIDDGSSGILNATSDDVETRIPAIVVKAYLRYVESK